MKKILIIDDSPFMRKLLKDLLLNSERPRLQAIEIYEADGKKSALVQLKKNKPDIILLDIVMQESEIEGLEFLQEVKDIYDARKIIMITSIGQPSIMEECKQFGIQNYLQKPFENAQVVDMVNKALA